MDPNIPDEMKTKKRITLWRLFLYVWQFLNNVVEFIMKGARR